MGSYLREIQRDGEPDSDQTEWVCLEEQQLWEHAKWVAQARFERLFGDVLRESWLLDSPDSSTEEKAGAILRREGKYVALVDEDKRFKGLVDRQDVLEKVAHHTGQRMVTLRK